MANFRGFLRDPEIGSETRRRTGLKGDFGNLSGHLNHDPPRRKAQADLAPSFRFIWKLLKARPKGEV